MPDLKPQIPDFQPGQKRISADDLNSLRDSGLRQLTGSLNIDGNGVQVRKFGGRINVKYDQAKLIPLEESLFFVLEEKDDYLICGYFGYCKPWVTPLQQYQYSPSEPEGVLSSGVVYVSKPFLLQRNVFDGATVQLYDETVTYSYLGSNMRNATDQFGNIEPQRIIPAYFAGDVITARPLASPILAGQVVEDGEPEPIYTQWYDMNTGARAWAAVLS